MQVVGNISSVELVWQGTIFWKTEDYMWTRLILNNGTQQTSKIYLTLIRWPEIFTNKMTRSLGRNYHEHGTNEGW